MVMEGTEVSKKVIIKKNRINKVVGKNYNVKENVCFAVKKERNVSHFICW